MMDAHDGKILILRCPNHRQLEIPPCGKGSRVSRHPLDFCRVQTDPGEANASFRSGNPAAVLKRNRTYVHVLYRQGDDLSREIREIVENGYFF